MGYKFPLLAEEKEVLSISCLLYVSYLLGLKCRESNVEAKATNMFYSMRQR